MAPKNLSARRRLLRIVSICGLFLLTAAFAAMPVAADKHGGSSGKDGDKVAMNGDNGANRGPGNVADMHDADDANEHQGVADNDANEHQGAVAHDANDANEHQGVADNDANEHPGAVDNDANDNDDDDAPIMPVPAP